MDEAVIYHSKSEECKNFLREWVRLVDELSFFSTHDDFMTKVNYRHFKDSLGILCFGDIPLKSMGNLIGWFGSTLFFENNNFLPAYWFVNLETKESSGATQHHVEVPVFVQTGNFDLEEILIFVNDKDGHYTSHRVYSVYDDLWKKFGFSGDVYVSTALEDKYLSIICLMKLCTVVLDKIQKYMQSHDVPPPKTFISLDTEKSSSEKSLKSSSIKEKEKALSAEFKLISLLTDLVSSFQSSHKAETSAYHQLTIIADKIMLRNHRNEEIGCVGSPSYIVTNCRQLDVIEMELKKEILKQYCTECIEQDYTCDADTKLKLDQKIQGIVSLMERIRTPVDTLPYNVNSSEWRRKVAIRLNTGLENDKEEILKFLHVSATNQPVAMATGKTYLKADDGDDQNNQVKLKMLSGEFTKLLHELESKYEEDISVYSYEDYKKEKEMRESCTKLMSMPELKVVSCWPGTKCRPVKPQVDVLVAYTTRKEVEKISKTFTGINYSVLLKTYGEDSEEEKRIYQNEITTRMSRQTRKLIQYVINIHSKELIKRHSNLSFVKPSNFLSHDHGVYSYIEVKPCIVIYCTYKGVVPLGEKKFPKVLGGYSVDVREGIVLPCGAQNYCDPLSMGSSVGLQGKKSAGSIGLFVQEKDSPETCGFITCCHVLFGNLFTTQLRQYVRCSHSQRQSQYWVMQESDFDVQESVEMTDANNSASNRLTNEISATSNVRNCGMVRDIFYGTCKVQLESTSGAFIDVGVDAAYVEITKRSPKMATIAERDQTNHRGKRICDFQIGDILEELSENDEYKVFYKCGRTSQFTKGVFETMGDLQIYKDPKDLSKGFTYLPNQYMILSTHGQPFLDHGDSGAAVFINKGGKLRCIGIGVSKSNINGKFAFVTPIKAVLKALEPVLEAKRFHLNNNNYRF